MPWCPKCGLEYVEGVKECPDCKLPLKPAPLLAETWQYDPDDWVAVAEVSDMHEAELIHGLLEHKGIAAVVRDHQGALRNLYGSVGNLGERVKVYVHKDRVEEAKAILRRTVYWTEESLADYMRKKGELGEEEDEEE